MVDSSPRERAERIATYKEIIDCMAQEKFDFRRNWDEELAKVLAEMSWYKRWWFEICWHCWLKWRKPKW